MKMLKASLYENTIIRSCRRLMMSEKEVLNLVTGSELCGCTDSVSRTRRIMQINLTLGT